MTKRADYSGGLRADAENWSLGIVSAGESQSHPPPIEFGCQQLTAKGKVRHFNKGEKIYSEGESPNFIFNIIAGVAKTCSGTDRRQITRFVYPKQLLGLSDTGSYTTSALAVTPVDAFALPTRCFWDELSRGTGFELQIINKLRDELQQARQHALLLAQRDALVKIAMFLRLQGELQTTGQQPTTEIYLPMHRQDIAECIGLALATVSRGFRQLVMRNIIRMRGMHLVTIVDPKALERLGAS